MIGLWTKWRQLDISHFSDSLSGHDVESFAESCEDEEIDSDYNIDCSVDSDLNSLQPFCLYDSEIKYKT